MSEVTQLLKRLAAGDSPGHEELLPLIYIELRALARQHLDRERSDHTLQTTALVHEAYLRIFGEQQPTDWNSRGHFFRAAAEAMRRILVEHARSRKRLKRGGDCRRVDLELDELLVLPRDDDILALDESLGRLSEADPRSATVVELRFFAGLTMPRIAEMLGVSVATVEREWAYARAWLHQAMTRPD